MEMNQTTYEPINTDMNYDYECTNECYKLWTNEPKYEYTKYENEPNNQRTNKCTAEWMLWTTNELKYERMKYENEPNKIRTYQTKVWSTTTHGV